MAEIVPLAEAVAELVAVPALAPDVAIVHAQQADRAGNVQLWGIPGAQKEAVLAALEELLGR